MLAGYTYGYDGVSRLTSVTSTVEGLSTFTYDATSQVVGADHAVGGQADETYGYDLNGNRNTSGYTTATNNRTTVAAGFTYTYDDQGNRTSRTETSTGKVTEYSWDHRNRLVTVKDRNSSGGSVVKQVDYAYDAFNRLVKRTYDADGAGAGAATNQFWVYDEGINAVLQFDGPAATDLTHRYLWTGVVDELMADETVGSGADTLYALGDHLGTIRDIANFNESTSATTVTNHRTYNSFGKLVSETNTAVDLIFGYTGKQLDEATGLQHNLFRWYDSELGQWLSEDPMGFGAEDENLKRYVGNRSIEARDPSGLKNNIPNPYWSPLRWLWTGDPHAPDNVYNSALVAAGGSVKDNNIRTGLTGLSYVDPTPLSGGVDSIICGIEEGRAALAIARDIGLDFAPGPNPNKFVKASAVVSTASNVVPKPKFRGGTHAQMTADKYRNDGLDSHHMPSDQASNLTRADGPAIQMDPTHHRQTASYGGGPGSLQQAYRDMQKKLIDAGDFDNAFLMDVDDIRSIPGVGIMYDDAMLEAIDHLPR